MVGIVTLYTNKRKRESIRWLWMKFSSINGVDAAYLIIYFVENLTGLPGLKTFGAEPESNNVKSLF